MSYFNDLINDKLLVNQFHDLYHDGKSVSDICEILNISSYYGYKIKKFLNLEIEKWQKLGLPSQFSNEINEILVGTLLGDSSLTFRSKNAFFSVCHSNTQIEYLKHKRDILTELKPYPIVGPTGKWNDVKFQTTCHPIFTRMHHDWYSSGSKQVPESCAQFLTPRAFAYWFMDDGTNQNGYCLALSTCSFNERSHEILLDALLKYGIKSRILFSKYPKLYISSKYAVDFVNLISEFVIPSMLYKIQLKPGCGFGFGHNVKKLSKNDVLKIRLLSNNGSKIKDISNMFSISTSHVSRILNEKRWRLS